MRGPSKQTDWLGRIPDWLKAVIGLFGTIGAIAGFILAFRENATLYTTISVVLLLAYLFLLSLYIFIARTKTRSKKNPTAHKYGSYRYFGLLGMLVICLMVGAASLQPFVQGFVREAVSGPFTPTPTVTPSPTLTPLPTSTLVPTATVTAPPQLESPDVWIAKFSVEGGAEDQWAESQIEQELRTRFEEFQGQRVTVRTDGPPVATDGEALDILRNSKSKVVIWGKYTGSQAEVRMLLADSTNDITPVSMTGLLDVISDRKSKDNTEQVRVTFFKEKLPQNISFMTLFVIGHIAYLSNHYQAGHEAFDAAMRALPEDALISNRALIHFFQARSLQKQDTPDLTGAICEYVEAILGDTQNSLQSGVTQVADIAYSNLGMTISHFYGNFKPVSAAPNTPIPVEALSCLERLRQAGLLGVEEDDQDPKVYFQHAVDLNPNLTFAAYNKTAFAWLQNPNQYNADVVEQIESQLHEIQAKDDSLIGTYMLLGSIEDGLGHYGAALPIYLDGIKRNSNIGLLHFNAGQLYVLTEQNSEEAEKHFKQTLLLDPNDQNAHLALANLYYRLGKTEEAVHELDALLTILETAKYYYVPRSDAFVLRSALAFQEGDIPAAREYLIEILKAYPKEPLLHFLLGMLYQMDGLTDQATASFDTVKQLDPLDTPLCPYGKEFGAFGDQWQKFRDQCLKTDEVRSMIFSDWALNRFPGSPCMGESLTDSKAQMIGLYKLVSDRMLAYRYPALFNILGGQCPYVYTDDPVTGEWKIQTTILYKIVDHEAAQIRLLHAFNGRLLIREEEREISYINLIYVLATMSDGSQQILEPNLAELKNVDRDYIILHQGEQLVVSFDDYPLVGDVREWSVMAVGYYSPVGTP